MTRASVLLAASWLAAALIAPAPVRAAAIAEIGEAFLGLGVGHGMVGGGGFVTPAPGEITLSLTAAPPSVTSATTGDGTVSHATVIDTRPGSASASVTAAARVGDQGTALLDLAVTLTATLRNDGARSFDALLVMLAFSAVAPTGGPVLATGLSGVAQPIVAGQTIALAADTTREAARAASRLSGPQADDAHACTTEAAHSPGGGIVVMPVPPAGRACAVASPDLSEDYLLLAGFDPGETAQFSWTVGITVEAFTIASLTAVPEPTALTLLAGGLLGLAALGARGRRRDGVRCLTRGAPAT